MLETGNNIFTNNSLSIRLSAGGFSFFKPVGRQDCAVEPGVPLAQSLDMAIRRHLKQASYTSVRLLVDSPCTRVPIDEFRSQEVRSLFETTFGAPLPHGVEVRYEVIPSLELVELFSIETDALNVVMDHFPKATVHGFYGQLLSEAFSTEHLRPSRYRRLFVSVGGSMMFLFAFEGRKLLFANTFDTTVTANRLYYVLSVWKMLQFNQRKDQCLLCGRSEELENSLREFIYKVSCV